MYAIITTEEYKDLLQAQKDAELYRKCYADAKLRLSAITNEFNELLLLITNGKTKAEWSDGLFQYFDLAHTDVIAKHINEKYVEDGILVLKENDND